MLAKYNIEYTIPFNRHSQTQHHLTNDPVACEEFLAELIERKFRIRSVHHEGVALPEAEFDRLLKTAAGMVMTKHLCASLEIDSAEAHHRFGTPA